MNHSAPTTVPQLRKRGRWLRLLWLIPLQLLVVAIMFFSWILGSESGLRFGLGLTQDFVPGLLQVEQARGRVFGNLSLVGVRVRLPDLELDLGSLDLFWRPSMMLTGVIQVKKFVARDVVILTAPSQQQQGPIKLPTITLLPDVVLEQVLVERLSIGKKGGPPPFRVERASLSASLHDSELQLEQFALNLPDQSLNASVQGGVRLSGDYPLDFSLSWDLKRKPDIRLEGQARVDGDLNNMIIKHQLAGSAQVKLEAVLKQILESPHWQAEVEILNVDLPAFDDGLPAANISGLLQINGDLEDAHVSANIRGKAVDYADFGLFKLDLDVVIAERILDIVALELTEDKSGAYLSADGKVDLNQPERRFRFSATWNKLRWPLTGESVVQSVKGSVVAEGDLDDFSYRVSTAVKGHDIPATTLRLVGVGGLGKTQIQELILDTLGGRIEAQGRVGWVPEPVWDLALEANNINPGMQWPAVPAKIDIKLTSAGGLTGFDYDLDADIQSTELPTTQLSIVGNGDIATAKTSTLRIETLGGTLVGDAEVGWDPRISWNLALTAEDIDPGVQWQEWAGNLGGRVSGLGAIDVEDGLNFSAVIEGIKGELRGYPVTAEAKVQMQGSDIIIEQLELASGPTHLAVQGEVGEQLNLIFDLNSPDLKSLLPQAAGSIQAKGSAVGSSTAPTVKLDLVANQLAYAGHGIERLNGKADLTLGADLKLELSGEHLVSGGMTFNDFRVTANGKVDSHSLMIQIEGEPLALEMLGQGGLQENGNYAGKLTALQLGSADYGNWRLQQDVAFSYAEQRISAGQICIREAGGSGGCLHLQQLAAANWKADLGLDKLAFDLLVGLIPADLDLEGMAKAKASFETVDGVLTGSARIDVPNGVLRADDGKHAVSIDFSSARLQLNAKGDGLKAKIDMPLAGMGGLDAEIELPGWRANDPARPDQAVRGRIKAKLDNLSFVSRLVPDINEVSGRIDADFGLAGSIAEPVLKGYAKLLDAGLSVPLLGFKLKNSVISAEADGLGGLKYSGGLTVGEGTLELKGRSWIGDGGLITEISAVGESLRVVDTNEYYATLSPAIELKVGPAGTNLSGKIIVSEARIRPSTIPAGIVSPSADVVVLTSTTLQEDADSSATTINLLLTLGETIDINAFGLTGKLEGELRVLMNPGDEEIMGDGRLAVNEGTYRISKGALSTVIGKPLIVEQGILNWAKSDLKNPFMVLTAKRERGDVTAGMKVFGTLRAPKMTFFSASDPGMSQAAISTYLLTGVPPGGKGEKESNSLSVGTYVAPNLFIEYDHSLGGESDKVKLRYDLNSKIELQTETGDSQGADIFFKWER